MSMINLRFLLAVTCLGALIGTQSRATIIVTNRYDFEPTSSYVTQTGWTHMDQATAYTGSSAGFHLGGVSVFLGGYDRVTSTQSPTDVTRDLIIGWSQNVGSNPTIVFRDIVPAHSTNVSFTIWRSDPVDSYNSSFDTYVSYDGGSQTLVPSVDGSGFYHTPITGSLALNPSPVNTTLDFYFYSFSGDTDFPTALRLNGIEALYTTVLPEPSTAMLLGLGAAILYHRRRQA